MKKMLISAPSFYGIDISIKKAFEALDFEVVLYNNRMPSTKIERAAKIAGNKFPLLRPLTNMILKTYLLRENALFLRQCSLYCPDVVFVIKGEHLFPETLKKIRLTTKAPILSYIWDDPFYSYAGRYSDDFRKNNFALSMDLYDHIFVYDTFYVEEIRKRGIKNVSYLPLATDAKECRPVTISEEEKALYGFDVCFVGSPFPNRIQALDALSDFRVGVFGDGWQKLKKPYYKGKAFGEKVLKIYAASKIVLNIHDPEAAHSVNTRTFDIPACDAFELTDYKPEMDNLFNVGNEIVCYKDIQDLREKTKRYLSDDNGRAMIAASGMKRVLLEHTWYHRMKTVRDYIVACKGR